jgi:DNA polymerase III delta subunit
MILLIHGADIAASRKFFSDKKETSPHAISLDGEKVTITDLLQIFEGGELFSESKTVFIEQLLSKRKKSNELTQLLTIIENHASGHTIVIWEGKELEKSALTHFKTAEVRVFKLPQTLFTFLDNLKPKNNKQLLTLFHQTLETTEVEMVFFMLVRQIRMLLALLENANQPIDELKRLAPWQRTKLERQAAAFGKKKLIKLYQSLFSVEVAQKTGNLTANLVTTIDFLLADL